MGIRCVHQKIIFVVNGRWNETISIVRYIEAYIGTCPILSPPPPPPPPPRQVLLRYIDI